MKMKVTWSGIFSPYDENTVKRFAPTSGGVYLLSVKLKNGKWKCFYVGKAANLRERLLDHLSEGEENECIKKKVTDYICGFEFAEVSREIDRKGIEKFLYDRIKPECNQVDPGGSSIEVNLPV